MMLVSLENYYWRYTSASELVNMILQFTESRAVVLFSREEFSDLSESMVQMLMSRELGLPEIAKFEAMLLWARARMKKITCRDANLEFRCTMERLTRDLKLYKISPTDLIKVVLPTKAIHNERILETLMYQANSGIYRVQASYLQECRRTLRRQETLAAGTSEYSSTPSPTASAAAAARALYRQETVQGVEGAEGLAGQVAATAAAANLQRRASTMVAAFTRSKDSTGRKDSGSSRKRDGS